MQTKRVWWCCFFFVLILFCWLFFISFLLSSPFSFRFSYRHHFLFGSIWFVFFLFQAQKRKKKWKKLSKVSNPRNKRQKTNNTNNKMTIPETPPHQTKIPHRTKQHIFISQVGTIPTNDCFPFSSPANVDRCPNRRPLDILISDQTFTCIFV